MFLDDGSELHVHNRCRGSLFDFIGSIVAPILDLLMTLMPYSQLADNDGVS